MSTRRPHRLLLLGSPDVLVLDGVDPLPLLRQPKRFALLSYLAVRHAGGWVGRDDLLAVFWPEVAESRARASLRQAIQFIRATLGADAILARGQELRINAEHLLCDAVLFESHISSGRTRDALQLYRGDFLDGFHAARCDNGFHDWVYLRRMRFKRHAAAAAWRLADDEEARGDFEPAAFWGKRALALSPFDEIHVRRLMLLLDRMGDRVGALRAYRGLERWFAAELDAQPSPESRALARSIRERGEPGEDAAEAFGARRTPTDRRASDRREVPGASVTPERRFGADRRTSEERRSAGERRGNLPPSDKSRE